MKKSIFLVALIALLFEYVNAKNTVPKIVDIKYFTDKIHVTFMLENNEKKTYIKSFDGEETMNTAGYAFSIFQGVSDNEICLESHHGNAYKEYNIMCYTYEKSKNDWIHTHDMIGTYYQLSNIGDYKIKDNFIYYKSDNHEGFYNTNKQYDSNRFLATPKEIENFLKIKLKLKETIFFNPINLVKCIKVFPIRNKNISLYNEILFYLQQANADDEVDYLLEQINTFKENKIILLKKQPLYSSPNVKTKMYLIKGDKVEILEEKDDWLYILYRGKKDIKAWIPKSAVQKQEIKQPVNNIKENTSKIEAIKKEEKTFFTKLLELFGSSISTKNIMQS